MSHMTTSEPESIHRGSESSEETPNVLFTKRGCCCIPFFGSNQSKTGGLPWWERVGTGGNEERWWYKGIRSLKKLREWSEILAGPRWKTFIRRFNRSNSGGSRHAKFQYDPLSYALNFDEGPGQNSQYEDDSGSVARDFSSRYASPSLSAKTSVDFGKNIPVFK